MTQDESLARGPAPSAITISSWPEPLLWRHYVIAQFAGASLGLISPDFSSLALDISGDAVVIHAVLKRVSPEAIDDLDEICFELDVLLEGRTSVSHRESYGVEDGWPHRGIVLVYRAK